MYCCIGGRVSSTIAELSGGLHVQIALSSSVACSGERGWNGVGLCAEMIMMTLI